MVSNEAVRVDQVPRRLIALVVGATGSAVAVEDAGIAAGVHFFDSPLDTVDEAQVLEAGIHAEAVLLIAALFEAGVLARYVSLAVELGLTPLVEVHDEREADLALESGARVIGVNNRDLRDFAVDLTATERLAGRLAGARRWSPRAA